LCPTSRQQPHSLSDIPVGAGQPGTETLSMPMRAKIESVNGTIERRRDTPVLVEQVEACERPHPEVGCLLLEPMVPA
jgi:hypothetical protein